MSNKSYKYIYGPVSSWRLGSSLGIDPVSGKRKICSFDCIYCQIGRTKIYSDERKIFVSVREVIEEIDSLAPMEIDYITFSGKGEPTLAKNLGQMIKTIKKIRSGRVAVLTNSSLMDREDVHRDLSLADFVAVKLDAASGEVFEAVNRPLETIKFDTVIKGIKKFRNCYKGKFALQIMFVEENKKHAEEIAKIAKDINPDEVQINTPLRPCDVEPLSRAQLDAVKVFFEGLNTISVYEAEKKQVTPISNKDTLRRRGKI
jgi:wyosine [tRNA(Phe)-imidazoG37] synthetase (radical SAM superfamily)